MWEGVGGTGGAEGGNLVFNLILSAEGGRGGRDSFRKMAALFLR